MKAPSQLLNKRVKIVSDNENYTPYIDKVLICTYASREGNGYDSAVYPELLCDFTCEDGEQFPFALYEYEFEII